MEAEAVVTLADTIDRRSRALVLMAGFGGLRLGELLALRPRNIEFRSATVQADMQMVELSRRHARG